MKDAHSTTARAASGGAPAGAGTTPPRSTRARATTTASAKPRLAWARRGEPTTWTMAIATAKKATPGACMPQPVSVPTRPTCTKPVSSTGPSHCRAVAGAAFDPMTASTARPP